MTARIAAALFLAATFGGIAAAAAPAPSAQAAGGPIAFYGDFGNAVGGNNPLLVRPPMVMLAEDGSVALIHLHWTGWGSSRAVAQGMWSASSCNPSCATGKVTNLPARLTLSSPGMVEGHRVYRCFEVSPAHPRRDMADRGCVRRQGSYYGYQ